MWSTLSNINRHDGLACASNFEYFVVCVDTPTSQKIIDWRITWNLLCHGCHALLHLLPHVTSETIMFDSDRNNWIFGTMDFVWNPPFPCAAWWQRTNAMHAGFREEEFHAATNGCVYCKNGTMVIPMPSQQSGESKRIGFVFIFVTPSPSALSIRRNS